MGLDRIVCPANSCKPHALLSGCKPLKTFLTVSLSEPFEGFHYKLVAGVVYLPA